MKLKKLYIAGMIIGSMNLMAELPIFPPVSSDAIVIEDSVKPYTNKQLWYGKRSMGETVMLTNIAFGYFEMRSYIENEEAGWPGTFALEGDDCDGRLNTGESCTLSVEGMLEEEYKWIPDRLVIENTEYYNDRIYVTLYGGDKKIKIKPSSDLASRSIRGKRPRAIVVNIKNKSKKAKMIQEVVEITEGTVTYPMFKVKTQGGVLDAPYLNACGPLPHKLRPNESCSVTVSMNPNGDGSYWGFSAEEDADFFRGFIGVKTTNVKGKNAIWNVENIWAKQTMNENEFWLGRWPDVVVEDD